MGNQRLCVGGRRWFASVVGVWCRVVSVDGDIALWSVVALVLGTFNIPEGLRKRDFGGWVTRDVSESSRKNREDVEGSAAAAVAASAMCLGRTGCTYHYEAVAARPWERLTY